MSGAIMRVQPGQPVPAGVAGRKPEPRQLSRGVTLCVKGRESFLGSAAALCARKSHTASHRSRERPRRGFHSHGAAARAEAVSGAEQREVGAESMGFREGAAGAGEAAEPVTSQRGSASSSTSATAAVGDRQTGAASAPIRAEEGGTLGVRSGAEGDGGGSDVSSRPLTWEQDLERQVLAQVEREADLSAQFRKQGLALTGRLKGTPHQPLPGADMDYSDLLALLQQGRVQYAEYGDYGRHVAGMGSIPSSPPWGSNAFRT